MDSLSHRPGCAPEAHWDTSGPDSGSALQEAYSALQSAELSANNCMPCLTAALCRDALSPGCDSAPTGTTMASHTPMPQPQAVTRKVRASPPGSRQQPSAPGDWKTPQHKILLVFLPVKETNPCSSLLTPTQRLLPSMWMEYLGQALVRCSCAPPRHLQGNLALR